MTHCYLWLMVRSRGFGERDAVAQNIDYHAREVWCIGMPIKTVKMIAISRIGELGVENLEAPQNPRVLSST